MVSAYCLKQHSCASSFCSADAVLNGNAKQVRIGESDYAWLFVNNTPFTIGWRK